MFIMIQINYKWVYQRKIEKLFYSRKISAVYVFVVRNFKKYFIIESSL